MRFGVCCDLAEAPIALSSGFDYVELAAQTLAKAVDLSAYRELPIEATNLFFPSEVRLFGPDRTPYLDYARRSVEVAASLGVQTMVIGSGGSRKAPAGIDPRTATTDFVNIAAEIQAIARPLGIVVAPESLNRTETNVANDLDSLATALAAKRVGYTADSYHVLFEWRADAPEEAVPSEDLWRSQIPIVPSHVHIADLPRFAPSAQDPMVVGFAQRLLNLKYDGRISLECRREDPAAELPLALGRLRSLFGLI